jgi:hypothetical protein
MYILAGMGFLHVLSDNWFTLLQSAGIIASLLFTAVSLRMETKSRQVSNLFTITENHREIWKRVSERPELARVLKPDIDLSRLPVGEEEEIFLREIILHLNASYVAIKDKVFVKPEGLEREVQWFFSLPVPNAVWQKMKPFQDANFIGFVESCQVG